MSFTVPPIAREVTVEAVAGERKRSPPAAATRQRAPSFAFNSGAGSVASGPGVAAPGGAAARRRRTLPAPLLNARGASRVWRAYDTARRGFQGALPLGPSAGGMAGVFE